MIADQDRSGWIGASDTSYVMSNWNTKTFQKWWMTKLGLNRKHFENESTKAGTNWEHKILDSLHIDGMEKDKQILIPELRLRVNLDGNTGGHIVEVKTHKEEKPYKITAAHRRQVNVQMYAMRHIVCEDVSAEIASYGLTKEDYRNFFRDIDPERLREHPVEYDETFIVAWLPRITYLADCLEKGVFPHEEPH